MREFVEELAAMIPRAREALIRPLILRRPQVPRPLRRPLLLLLLLPRLLQEGRLSARRDETPGRSN